MRAFLVTVIVCGALTAAAGAHAGEPAQVKYLDSGKVLPAGLPFSEAVQVDHTLYLSGQLGITPGTLKLVAGGIKQEARQTMDNIRTTLQAHGYSMRDLVKCTVMLADIAEWPTFNAIYSTYFTERFPARSAFAASGLALGARVEVECIAVAPGKPD